MIPHPVVFSAFVLGIPQGVFLGIGMARGLGVTGLLEVVLMVLGGFLGIFIGYAEGVFLYRKFWKS